jgi:DNA-binding response OmpR family regulator
MDKKKILVVDDEEEILSLIQKKLSASNFACMATSKGSETLSLAKTFNPDLLLLDIVMPGMDGYAIAREMKRDKATTNIPIIFLTGKELEPRAINERVGEVGAIGFIMKPCSLKELLDKINSVIG